MLHQEVITVPTKLTGVEKDILACLFLEGAFTTDLALHAGEIHNLGKTAVYATDAERTAAGLRNLCEMKLVVHDPDGRFCWLTPMGNLYTGVLLGSTPKEKWSWI